MKTVKILLWSVVIALAAWFLAGNIVRKVEPGYYGAVETWGDVRDKSYPNGPVLVWPGLSKLVVFDVREQAYTFSVPVRACNMQNVTVNGTLNYQLVPQNVHRLYLAVGENYRPVLFDPLLKGTINKTIGKQTAEFIVYNQDMVVEAIRYIIEDQLNISQVAVLCNLNLEKSTFDKAYEEAIADKAVAEQVLARVKIETQRVEEEAQQMRLRLAAEADGLKMRSEALKNPLIVQYEFAKAMGKWKGDLPTTLMVGGGSVPIVPVKTK